METTIFLSIIVITDKNYFICDTVIYEAIAFCLYSPALKFEN